LELFNDKSLEIFFSQRTSWLVLMDMLYEAKRYDDVLKVMDSVSLSVRALQDKNKDRKFSSSSDSQDSEDYMYPLDCVTLTAASCYHLNTSKSLQYMVDLLKQIKSVKCIVTMRTAVYCAMLALKQDKADMALEMLAASDLPINRRAPLAYVNTKAMIYVKLGRLSDAVQLLRSVLERDEPDHVSRGDEIFEDVLTSVKSAVQSTDDKELKRHIEVIERSLQKDGHIAKQTFDQYLSRTILRNRRVQDGFKQRDRSLPSSMGGREQGQGQQRYQRQGRPGRPGILDRQ